MPSSAPPARPRKRPTTCSPSYRIFRCRLQQTPRGDAVLASPAARQPPRARGPKGLCDGFEGRERGFRPARPETRHDECQPQDRPQPLAGHSVQQVGPVAGQCPSRQGWHLDRGARGGHRPPRPAARAERAAGSQCRRRRDRHVRGAGRRPPVPRPRAAGQAEAAGEDRAGAVRRAHRRPRRRGLPRRERAPRPAAPARPVPCVPDLARAGAR